MRVTTEEIKQIAEGLAEAEGEKIYVVKAAINDYVARCNAGDTTPITITESYIREAIDFFADHDKARA